MLTSGFAMLRFLCTEIVVGLIFVVLLKKLPDWWLKEFPAGNCYTDPIKFLKVKK